MKVDIAETLWESLNGTPSLEQCYELADKILALEVEGERVRECSMTGGMCSDRQKDSSCTIGGFCDYQRPATIKDLIT